MLNSSLAVNTHLAFDSATRVPDIGDVHQAGLAGKGAYSVTPAAPLFCSPQSSMKPHTPLQCPAMHSVALAARLPAGGAGWLLP